MLIEVARLEHASHGPRHLIFHWRLPTRCLAGHSVPRGHQHAVVRCDSAHYVESRHVVEAHGLSQGALAWVSLSPNLVGSCLVHRSLIPVRCVLSGPIPVRVLLSEVHPCVRLYLSVKRSLLLLSPLCLPRASGDSLFECLLLDDPIVLKVEVVAFFHEQVSERLNVALIVRFLLELEFPARVEELAKLLRETDSEVFDARNRLLDFDLLILLLLGFGREPLPGQATLDEVHEDEAYHLDVVSPRLLDAEVGVEARVASCAREGLVVFEGDVSTGLGVFVAFGESKVNQVEHVLLLAGAYQEVVWLDVSVQEAVRVHVLYPLEL